MAGKKATSRRELLKKGIAGLGVGGITLTAGCGSGGDGDGGGQTDTPGDGDGGDGATPTATQELGERVSTEFLVGPESVYPVRFQWWEMIAEELRNLGIDVEFNPLALQQIVQKTVIQHDFQMFGFGYGGRIHRLDPDTFLQKWHTTEAIEAGQNMSEYSNPEYDALVEEQRTIFDPEERQEVVHEALAIQHEDAPVLVHNTRDLLIPLRVDRFSNPVTIPGEGLTSFQNLMNIEPAEGVSHFKFLRRGDIGNLNPLQGISTDHRTYRNFYDTLMRYDAETLQPEPWAAESVENVDETTVDVTLRDGLTFHDGEPLTVEDVKFSYEYMAEHSATFKSRVSAIDTVEITADNVVRFNLKQPFSPLLGVTFTTVYLLPKHIWEDIPESVDADKAGNWPNENPVGSAPFQFEVWNKQEEIRFSRFEDHPFQPNIDQFSFRPVPDVTTAMRFIETGDADATAEDLPIPPRNVDRFEGNDAVEVFNVKNHGPMQVTFQVQRNPGKHKAFRQAVGWVLPRQDIKDTVMAGAGTVENDQLITSTNEFWHNSDVEQRTYDPERARQILREAGFRWDDNGNLRYPVE